MKGENVPKQKKNTKPSEYEFCNICRINHNQGRRHNYFPRHANAVSALLSRFVNKLSLLDSACINPTLSLSDHASSSFWCIFCELDIFDDLGSLFARGNVIKHLASEDHLKNVKHFLWKYGGGNNKVDSFRVTEAKFAEWEKTCEALKCKAAKPNAIYQEEMNDIQHNCGILNNFEKNNINFSESNLSNNVLPLQYDTNENYQVCHSDISEVGKVDASYQHLGIPMPQGSKHCLNAWSSSYINYGSAHPLPFSAATLHADCHVHEGVHKNQRTTNTDPHLNGYQTLTRLTPVKSGDDVGNVYTGAPPPWLVGTETASDIGPSTATRSNSTQKNCRKTSKLNPKRVGAAWAEKRKKELEMEKRGEIIANTSDPNWLPDYGGVWQSGSRKESMKEFQKEKVNKLEADSDLQAEVKLQPYISKRMRTG